MQFPKRQKGTIALDIDGTITDLKGHVDEEIVIYLKDLVSQGFDLIFVTGREFVYAMQALSFFDFPYFLAVQNGADLLEMPSKKFLKSYHLSLQVVKDYEKIAKRLPDDFLLYAGFERGDYCYYRPERFSKEILGQIEAIKRRGSSDWKVVENFDNLEQKSFPMIKVLGFEKDFIEVQKELLKKHSVQTTVIKDPTSHYYDLFLITHLNASKGNAIQYFLDHYQLKRPLIAAGDDDNDESSLKLADISIAMGNAIPYLKTLADIIAPSAKDKGIIKGLEEAIKRIT